MKVLQRAWQASLSDEKGWSSCLGQPLPRLSASTQSSLPCGFLKPVLTPKASVVGQAAKDNSRLAAVQSRLYFPRLPCHDGPYTESVRCPPAHSFSHLCPLSSVICAPAQPGKHYTSKLRAEMDMKWKRRSFLSPSK